MPFMSRKHDIQQGHVKMHLSLKFSLLLKRQRLHYMWMASILECKYKIMRLMHWEYSLRRQTQDVL